jgi:hypothetical protein
MQVERLEYIEGENATRGGVTLGGIFYFWPAHVLVTAPLLVPLP